MRKKILIVDDEPGVLQMISLMLQNEGYDILTASNGEEGLRVVNESPPDLIISDILMPVMDGFAFYKKLKSNKLSANIPVVILTARGHMEDSLRVMGVDDFVEKPSEGSTLLSKISDVLDQTKESPGIKQQKVLIGGTYWDVVENMAIQIKREGHEAEYVCSGSEVITRGIISKPSIVVLNVQMNEIDSVDIVRVFRLLPQFKNIPILLYNFYKVEELGSEDFYQKTSLIDKCQKDCMNAGATVYFGRFNEISFLKVLSKYL